MKDRNERIEELFHAARAMQDVAERRAWLERATQGDAELRARVDELLASDAGAGTAFLAPVAPAPGERAGDVIGRYKLLQPIGEGGMGTVWMAEQREPVVRKVALKIVKLGMDTREVVVRFEAERQALALMEHPHIAKVLDGGATASGRPYFVMELVKGVPITEYCDKAKLGLRERLELFTRVCEAVQHAHHKGVIHRDLKPSNVLVTMHDGVPVPKVIDFGIAKATSAELTKKTLFTQYAQILGTPEYMAPEQAELSGLDIDTRADVYSLGVLLYELLTGTKPFDVGTALEAGYQELLRTIREVDPAKPSTRVSTLGERASPTAANRQVNVAAWSQRLRGDLDWIVMKALEKDRRRRYDTPNGFAEDVARYLRDEPVLAAPPSGLYRLAKFVRRRKKTVAAGALLALSLVAGIVGTSIGMLKARDAAAAEQLAKHDSEMRRAEAETNLAYARKGNAILGSVFARLDPKQDYATVAELRNALRDGLGEAVVALDGASIGDPLEVARLQCELALSLEALGECASAAELFQRAHATYLGHYGKEHEATLSAANGFAMSSLGAGAIETALPVLEETLALRRARFGAEHVETIEAMMNLAQGHHAAGRRAEAVRLYGDALPLYEAKMGPDARGTILCLGNLAQSELDVGKHDDAVQHFETAVERAKRALGPDHPETTRLQGRLATAYQHTKQRERALPLLVETLRALRERLGPDHPSTLTAMNDLASAYQQAGKVEKALPLLAETLRVQEAKYGEDHPNTLVGASNLGALYFQTGKNDLAIPLLEKTVRLQKAKLGADHPETLGGMGNLAAAYWRAKRLDDSIPMFEALLKAQEAKLGRAHPTTLGTIANLGVNYGTAGRWKDALPLQEEVRVAARSNPALRGALPDLLITYLHLEQFDEATALLAELVDDLRKSAKPESMQLASGLSAFGQAALEAKAFAMAEPLLRESLAIRAEAKPDAWQTFHVQSLLGAALLGEGKPDDAAPLLVRAYEGLKQRESTLPATSSRRLPEALDRLIELHTALKQPDEVKRWQALRAAYPKEPK